jgi:nitroreductase
MELFEAIRKRRSIRAFTDEAIPREHLETIVDAGRLAASGHNHQPWQFIVITDKAMMAKFTGAADWIEQSSAVIAVVMDSSSTFWVEDGSAAVTNIMLAATALGYGSCWIGGNTQKHEDKFKQLLGIPAEKRLLTFLPLGVPAESPTKEKKSLDEVIRWERY